MFDLQIENSKSELITLTQNESDFQIINVEGLNPPNATLNLSTIAGMDGAKFNSAKLETRNIVIYIKLNGDAERNRVFLYRYFNSKDKCKIFYKNELRNVYIEGYVESVEVSPFSDNEIMQISIMCPDTYFKSVDELIADISKLVSEFTFPFSINYRYPIAISSYIQNRVTSIVNKSESEAGLDIVINVLKDFNKITIRNTLTDEFMTLQHTFWEDDIIKISTHRGKKSVKLIRSEVESNIFSKLQAGYTFFQLASGINKFTYSVDDGTHDDYVRVKFYYNETFQGV